MSLSFGDFNGYAIDEIELLHSENHLSLEREETLLNPLQDYLKENEFLKGKWSKYALPNVNISADMARH